MRLSLKEALAISSLTVVLLVLRAFFDISDLSLGVLVVAAMLISIMWSVTPLLAARTKRKKYQEWIDHFDGRITFNEKGLFVAKPGGDLSIAWSGLVKVELTWDENPYGDPQFGPYCDTDWLLWENTGNAIRITESVNEVNSRILLEAFAEFLPDFNFDYAHFNENQKSRLFDLQGGRVLVWARNT